MLILYVEGVSEVVARVYKRHGIITALQDYQQHFGSFEGQSKQRRHS